MKRQSAARPSITLGSVHATVDGDGAGAASAGGGADADAGGGADATAAGTDDEGGVALGVIRDSGGETRRIGSWLVVHAASAEPASRPPIATPRAREDVIRRG